MNPRLKDLSIKLTQKIYGDLNAMDTKQVHAAIRRFDKGTNFDQGIAQFLRSYLAARTIGDTLRSRD